MFAEWVTTGVSWGIMIASAGFTIFVIAGFLIGVLSMLSWITKGGRDEDKDKKDWEDFNGPKRPA